MENIGNITPEFLTSVVFPDRKGKQLNYLMVIPHKAVNKYAFPVGLGIVTASLKASGRSVFCVNLDMYGEPLEKLKEEILSQRIDVMMVGGFSVEYHAIRSILRAARQAKPDLVTVVGGGIVTADPVPAMIALEEADYGMIGEGEITVNALSYAIEHGGDASRLPGVICRKDGEWVANTDFPETEDLDSIPYPDYEGFEYGRILYGDKYANKWTKRSGSNRILYLNITRSCPYLCTFCFHTCGNHFRSMSMDGIFRFLDWMLERYPGIEALSIDGELTLHNERFSLEFCRRLAPYHLKWRANTRADIVTEIMLRAMRECGCTSVMFGIESACNSILKNMKKRLTVEQIERAFEAADRAGIYARGTLIFGDPEETLDTLRTTLRWYLSHRKWSDIDCFWNITLGLIKAYPGTALYWDACSRGLIKDKVQFLKDGCPPINMSKLSDEVYDSLPALFQELYKEDAEKTLSWI